MRRKVIKLREFPLEGAKVNSTHIGTLRETYFAVGDSHNNVRLYTFEAEEEIAVYSNHNNQNVQTEVTAVSLSCNEQEIYSGSNRGIINVWDTETAKCNTPLRGHSTSVNCFGIYPEQPSKLVSGSYDTTIKLWDIRDKNCTATLKGHTKQINSLAVSPDGNLLLSGSEDNTARLWQLRMGERPIYISNQHNGPILKVKFNHEDCMFATCSADKTAKYFRCQEKCYGYASSTDMVSTPITSIGYSDDGKILYTAANDVLKSWNMYKNGLLLESFDTNWKGVQDMTMIKGALMGIGSSSGTLSLWFCDVNQKIKNNSKLSEGQQSFVLPKIGQKYSRKDNDFNIGELQNIVGEAIQKVNKIEDKVGKQVDSRREEFEKKKQQMQRKKEEQRKKQEEERKQREIEEKQKERQREIQRERLLLEQLMKQKEEREKKEQERIRKLDQEKRQQQRLYKERQERERIMQERLKKTFEEQNNMEPTMEYDILENSSLMNISTFVADGAQKEKLKQVEMIGDILKEKSKFESVLRERSSFIKPIINFWKQGKVGHAVELISKSNQVVMSQCTTAILNTPIFKQGITPEVGINLTACLNELMRTNKHSTYVTIAMNNIKSIVNLFKEELIKIKTFNPMTRVDLSRQERLAKYDKLIDEFMNVFRQDRLRKYYQKKKQGDSDDLCTAAFELYKNLEEVLIKIMPKQEPELA